MLCKDRLTLLLRVTAAAYVPPTPQAPVRSVPCTHLPVWTALTRPRAPPQVEISVQKTVHREIEGEITADVNLKTFGQRSAVGGDTDDHSSDVQSERGKAYLSSL